MGRAHLCAPIASRTPSTWSGMRRPSRTAPPWTPTWNPICSAASSAAASIAGKASLRGQTATAPLHASGPQIGGAS
eukprot:10050201-Lingulodinium_polyedra.AAC.1